MGFHYGIEQRKFDKEWEQMEQEYRTAGMTEEQIVAMREYDWAWFCSQRIFGNRTQVLPNEQYEDESEQSCLFQKFESLSFRWDAGDIDHTRYGWLSAVEDERLFHRLCKLSPEDLELLTLLFVDGYRQTDVAHLWNCSRSAVTQKLKKIKKYLKST